MAFKVTFILVATSVVYHVAVASDESVGAKVAAYDKMKKFFGNENPLNAVKKFQEAFGNETLENVAQKFKKMSENNKKLAASVDPVSKNASTLELHEVVKESRQINNPQVGQVRLGEKLLRTQKIARFLNEGHLPDVIIRAGVKTYKLHRYILNTACAYFSDPISTSSENSELDLDVDEKTFDLIVDFIYNDTIPEFDSSSKTLIMQLLKAAAILKSKLVIEKCCVPWLEKFREELSVEDIIELINAVGNDWQYEEWVRNEVYHFILRLKGNEICKGIFSLWQLCEDAGLDQLSWLLRQRLMAIIDVHDMKYENLLTVFDAICEANFTGEYSDMYIACLCKLIVAPRPELSVESHFLSVSCDVLEELLASDYFIISDTQKIVDICSKWIAHDVKNRYRLIPRIVFAINRNNSTDCRDFESNIPADCSQESIGEELWKLLKSNCLISRDLGSIKTVWNYKTRPMFILPKNVDRVTRMPSEVCVVDSEMNKMASLNFLLRHYNPSSKHDRIWDPKLSATLIGDTLFILCEIRDKFNVYAYNFSSKQMNILGSVPRRMYYPKDTLLNCNNQLFWCFDDGRVMKYSIELNRWLQLYFEPEWRNYGPYGSDGNMLLRYSNKTLQTFDFEQSSWTHLADQPWSVESLYFKSLTNFHNGFALANVADNVLLYHLDTRSWNVIPRPEFPFETPASNIFSGLELVPYGEDLWYVHANGIAQLACSSLMYGRWLIQKLASSNRELEGILAIHSTSYNVYS